MVRKILILHPVLYLLMLSGCAGHHRSSADVLPDYPKDFPAASVPSMVTDRQEMFVYLSGCFWDRYLDSASVWSHHDDSTMTGGVKKDVLFQKYMEYAQILWNVPAARALQVQERLMDRLGSAALGDTAMVRVFDALCLMAGECLYGVNSDFRNEEFYIPVLEKLISTPLVTPLTEEVMKGKYREELANCRRNRIGEVAADFIFTSADGVSGHLHGVKGDFILLFFSNPGCTACLEIINSLKGSEAVTSLLASGSLKILNIYIDEDLTEWFRYMPVYPKEWTNAYQGDLRVRQEGIYDVRAIPSLYILDGEKKVLFKDVNPNVALNFLEHLAE